MADEKIVNRPEWEGFVTGKWSDDEVNVRDFIQRNYTPYEGMEMAGRTDTVLLDGQVAVRDGKVVQEGLGHYVSRGPSQFWR